MRRISVNPNGSPPAPMPRGGQPSRKPRARCARRLPRQRVELGLLDAGELGTLLKLSRRTVQQMTLAGKIPAIRLGKLVRYRAAAVLAALGGDS